MAFDLTDFSGANNYPTPPANQPTPPANTLVQPTSAPSGGEGGELSKLAQEFNRVPAMTKHQRDMEQRRKEELPGAWGIDKAVEDGQMVAGEVDKEQAEFLANTTFVD